MKKLPSCNRCKRKRAVRQRPLCLFCLVRLRKLARNIRVMVAAGTGLDSSEGGVYEIELRAGELAEMVRQL